MERRYQVVIGLWALSSRPCGARWQRRHTLTPKVVRLPTQCRMLRVRAVRRGSLLRVKFDHSDERVDEFVGGGAPLLGGEVAAELGADDAGDAVKRRCKAAIDWRERPSTAIGCNAGPARRPWYTGPIV